jgi:hypothetical protein
MTASVKTSISLVAGLICYDNGIRRHHSGGGKPESTGEKYHPQLLRWCDSG